VVRVQSPAWELSNAIGMAKKKKKKMLRNPSLIKFKKMKKTQLLINSVSKPNAHILPKRYYLGPSV